MKFGEGCPFDQPFFKHVDEVVRSFNENTVCLWVDGSARPNPGRGGCGIFIEHLHDKTERCLSFPVGAKVTSFDCEVVAVFWALRVLQREYSAGCWRKARFVLITDNQPVYRTMMGRRKAHANAEQFLGIAREWRRFPYSLEIYWCRSHTGLRGNEMADRLAKQAGDFWVNLSDDQIANDRRVLDAVQYSEVAPDTVVFDWHTTDWRSTANLIFPVWQAWEITFHARLEAFSEGNEWLRETKQELRVMAEFDIRVLSKLHRFDRECWIQLMSGRGPFRARLWELGLMEGCFCVCGEWHTLAHVIYDCEAARVCDARDDFMRQCGDSVLDEYWKITDTRRLVKTWVLRAIWNLNDRGVPDVDLSLVRAVIRFYRAAMVASLGSAAMLRQTEEFVKLAEMEAEVVVEKDEAELKEPTE